MQRSLTRRRGPSLARLVFGVVAIGWGVGQLLPTQAEEQSGTESSPAEPSLNPEKLAQGRELFHRSWLPDDPRSPQGDGLGPLFNESSCVACHNQGGPGGGGSASKNVELLTAFVSQPVGGPNGPPLPSRPAAQRQAMAHELATIHPGFRESSSVVVHRFGTSSQHASWRANLLNPQFRPLPSLNAAAVRPGLSQDELVSTPMTFPVATDAPPIDEAVPERASPNSPPTDPPSEAPRDAFAPPTSPATTPALPDSLPSSPPVPAALTQPFQQTPQPEFGSQGIPATGIPLVDEALEEMRRLQQEVRQDLSGSTSRGRIVLLRSQRNTSALFGAGVIDAIPDAVIEAAARQKHEDFPRVQGRVHRLPDGKIGKFGWKAQKATLRDFTLAACANELGLDVPHHAQPPVPYEENRKPKGHDMTEQQTDALVAFVRQLPAPIQEVPEDQEAAKVIEQGRELFESVGCAVCHTPHLGKAKGLYSDLLLHDLGEQLQASGSYGTLLVPQEFDPAPHDPSQESAPEDKPQESEAPSTLPGNPQGNGQPPGGQTESTKPQSPSASEWRTPPLWGVRDSAPYLHDGRAATLEQAIALHGGEGSDAAIRFFLMPAKKQQRLIAFLKTLRAPEHGVAAR